MQCSTKKISYYKILLQCSTNNLLQTNTKLCRKCSYKNWEKKKSWNLVFLKILLSNLVLFWKKKNLSCIYSYIFRYYSLPEEEIRILDLPNPMCESFPRVASCTFWKYGSGGRPVGHQAICILSLNIVIDKGTIHKLRRQDFANFWPPSPLRRQVYYLCSTL